MIQYPNPFDKLNPELAYHLEHTKPAWHNNLDSTLCQRIEFAQFVSIFWSEFAPTLPDASRFYLLQLELPSLFPMLVIALCYITWNIMQGVPSVPNTCLAATRQRNVATGANPSTVCPFDRISRVAALEFQPPSLAWGIPAHLQPANNFR